MKHLAAYLLAVLGGNSSPDAAAIKKIVEAAGGEVDDAKASQVVSALSGKDLKELLDSGIAKLGNLAPAGGAAVAGAAPAAAAAEAPAEEEEEEEESEDMGFDLFG